MRKKLCRNTTAKRPGALVFGTGFPYAQVSPCHRGCLCRRAAARAEMEWKRNDHQASNGNAGRRAADAGGDLTREVHAPAAAT